MPSQIGTHLLILVLLGACSPASQQTGTATARGGAVRDYSSLVEHLRSSGLRVKEAGEIAQPFFTPKARVVTVEGDDLQIFHYGDENTAATEAGSVAPGGGSAGTHMMSWIAPPHFFRKGSLTVVYLGSNEKVLQALRGLLGQQFAGAS